MTDRTPDPTRYANRPPDSEFDPYRAVREHVARSVLPPIPRDERPSTVDAG